ncbi:hypothetical protein BFP76_10290 [Amylibacter kogurei]|uniref:Uncharacterized protein n=1 Tax=Paramylibacter kogurei TaxID=1889778 RepID=A0A2G5K0Y6_9RHOB|nr:hypothetical protein [Amylibacter kogurei]PIB22769.1 hypothetical protein BFP76_10290 [Amylibacter kogurei]
MGGNQKGVRISGNRAEVDHKTRLADGGSGDPKKMKAYCAMIAIKKKQEKRILIGKTMTMTKSHEAIERIPFLLEQVEGWPPV